jgi:hypothetical protein
LQVLLLLLLLLLVVVAIVLHSFRHPLTVQWPSQRLK